MTFANRERNNTFWSVICLFYVSWGLSEFHWASCGKLRLLLGRCCMMQNVGRRQKLGPVIKPKYTWTKNIRTGLVWTTKLMRNSEPQTGDVKIGLLSFFIIFFSLWDFPHYHLFIDFLSFVDWLFKRGRSVDFAFCLCTIVDEYTWRERKIDINYEFCFYYSSLIQRCSLFYIILDCVI